MATAENVLKNIEKIYQQKYGVAVFNIGIKNIKNGVEIKGDVLTENQRDYIMSALRKSKIKVKKESLKILSDASARNEIGWAVVKGKVGTGLKPVPVDLKLRFVSNKIINNKILKRIRCSQAFRGEILRVLFKKEDQLLVQQNDLTLGWVDRKDVILKRNFSDSNPPQFPLSGGLIPPLSGGEVSSSSDERRTIPDKERTIDSPSDKEGISLCPPPDKGGLGGVRKHQKLDMYEKWKQNNFALKNKIIKASEILAFVNGFHGSAGTMEPVDFLQNKIIEEAEKFLGAKYVLGGKSKKGIDCSGLTQVVYKNAVNIILPRHSWDQRKMGKCNQRKVGKKVNLNNVKSGDLVFLVKKKNNHKHVGIVEIIKSSVKPKANKRLFAFGLTAGHDINLIHASLEKKKVVRQNLEEVFEKYNFVEVRRIIG